MKIVLASNNIKKVREMRACLPAEFELATASDFQIESPPETGTTFVENAIIKARHSSQVAGIPSIADDSGLEVDFLNGKPGIYSARYAGPEASDADNNKKLLSVMDGVETRTARFRCVIVYLRHALDPMPIIAAGTWEGEIINQPDGDGGFGYDPLFFVPEFGKTVAKMSAEHKRQFSHRGQALLEFIRLFNAS
jgi:XTP/dITP diphosphohydrolase